MSAPIRVARIDEIPPGRAKTVQLGARTVTIYNVEGRLFSDEGPFLVRKARFDS